MQKIGRALSWTEQQRLLGAIQQDSTAIQSVILLQLRAGLRISEALRLPWHCLSPHPSEPTYIAIPAELTKDDQPRDIPAAADLRTHLQATYAHINLIISGHDLKTQRIVSTPEKRKFTARWANYKLRTICKRAGIASIHTHTLRATFATNVLRVSNLKIVQLLLGHESLASTQRYLHPDVDVITRAVQDAACWLPPAEPTAAPTESPAP